MPEGRANKAATPCTRVGSFKLLFLVRAIVGIVGGEKRASQPNQLMRQEKLVRGQNG